MLQSSEHKTSQTLLKRHSRLTPWVIRTFSAVNVESDDKGRPTMKVPMGFP